MANTRKYIHTQKTLCKKDGSEEIIFNKVTLYDVKTSEKSSVNAIGKILFSGTCTTAAGTAAKTVAIDGFALVAGAHLTVRFTNGISSSNSTLSVNNTGAKPIKLNNVALQPGIILANNNLVLQYDGSAFQIVGGAGSVKVSKANTKKLFLIGVPTEVNGSPTDEHYNTTVYIDATGTKLYAPNFYGNGENLTDLDATKITSGTLNASRLATSGATAGTYGTAQDVTLGFENTFTVPKITVDNKGRVIDITNINLKLMKNPDTDVKVTTTVANTTRFYLAGSADGATCTGTLLKDTGIYADATAGRLVATSLWSGTLYLNAADKYITAANYTGQAATVASITAHLRDNLSGNGVTNMALTANQGYKLSQSISANATNIGTCNTKIAANTTNIGACNTKITANTNAISAINARLGTQVTYTLSGSTLYITTK